MCCRPIILALLSVLATATPAGAQGLYKCVDGGRVIYSGTPCVSAPAGSPGARSGAKMTAEHVLSFVRAVDRSAARMDWDVYSDYIAEDAVIHIELKSAKRGGRTSIGKAEYRRLMDEAKEKIRNYSLRREGVRVTVAPDGDRAEMASKLTEYWSDPGGAVMTNSEETWIVEPRGGRLKIVILDIVTRGPQPQPPLQR